MNATRTAATFRLDPDEGRSGGESAKLADFAAGLNFDDIPLPVVERTVDFFVDWVGSALSGAGQRAISALEEYSSLMGPATGASEILTSGKWTSPFFASAINAAASHISEQDDVHNGSVFHPAAVVFPAALATAQHHGVSGRDFIAACVAGYEIGIRVGEFLGRSHYRIFHTTGTAGTIAAAAATGRLLGLEPSSMLHAIGSAGTTAAGLWEFLRDAADSKQLHTAHAASSGLAAAYLARQGFTGARRILEGQQGMGAGMSTDANSARLAEGLGTRWTVLETSFKFHASCRHTHPAADALLQVVEAHDLAPSDIAGVVAHVHQGAIDVLGPVTDPTTVHQAKFSMPATLGLIATHRRAGMAEFDGFFSDDAARTFLDRVTMQRDADVDGAYPDRWIGKVSVRLRDGTVLDGLVEEPKGDPGNTLMRDEIDAKARRLAAYGKVLDNTAIDRLMPQLWAIAGSNGMGRLL